MTHRIAGTARLELTAPSTSLQVLTMRVHIGLIVIALMIMIVYDSTCNNSETSKSHLGVAAGPGAILLLLRYIVLFDYCTLLHARDCPPPGHPTAPTYRWPRTA